MYNKLTGSLSTPPHPSRIVGSLHFLDDGYLEMSLSESDHITDLDKSLFFLAADFSAYAFDRKDWMEEFLLQYHPDHEKTTPDQEPEKPDLTLIIGGLKDSEVDQ